MIVYTCAVTVENFEPRNGSAKAITFEYLTKCHQRITSVKVIDWTVSYELPLLHILLRDKFNEEKKSFKLKIKELNNRLLEME